MNELRQIKTFFRDAFLSCGISFVGALLFGFGAAYMRNWAGMADIIQSTSWLVILLVGLFFLHLFALVGVMPWDMDNPVGYMVGVACFTTFQSIISAIDFTSSSYIFFWGTGLIVALLGYNDYTVTEDAPYTGPERRKKVRG